jgi:diadenosine tetraphosphatase ApaH/serine/threonine PP2A family protein phosphatase
MKIRGGGGQNRIEDPDQPSENSTMIYIIFSDVHGNLEAFDAAVKSMPDAKDKKLLCAGDVVGYGANPNECIDKVISLGASNIKGNHEAAALGQMDISIFNRSAAEAIRWTTKQLMPDGSAYIDSLPLIHEEPSFTMVHGTLHDPEDFRYMLTNVEAAQTFEVLEKKICFVGHSHVPAVFSLEDGRMDLSFKNKFKLKKKAKYIINVGSVGQPRDGDRRACYCVYDSAREEVELRRVEYDVETAQKKIIDAGLPRMLADRLTFGR